jgi:dipeptidyl aminopeptidase B
MWWSPDSSRVAYLRFDETKVSEFTFPIYNPTNDANSVIPYPNHVTMKYPKPGYDNPLVTVHIFDFDSYEESVQDSWAPSVSSHVWTLSWEKQRPTTDSIIQEVAWVNDAALIIKEVARAGDDGNVIYFDLTDPRKPGKVVRRLGKDGEEGDKGWIDSVRLIRLVLVINLNDFQSQNIKPLDYEDSAGYPTSYLDILPNKEGYNHIALFSPADSSEPKWLTTGPWEVTSDILGIDYEKGLV